MFRHPFFASFTALALVGCGGSPTSNDQSPSATSGDGGEESSGMTPSDAGANDSGVGAHDAGGGATQDGSDSATGEDAGHTPSSTYPAFPVDTGTIISNGGSVLATPKIVTVTWSTDTNAATWNAFGDAIGASTFWHAVNSEYGVGPATSGSHVSLTAALASSMTDMELDTFVSTNVSNGTFPAYTPDTIYTLFVPSTTSLSLQGADACKQGVLGYHTTAMTGGYVYAVVLECANEPVDMIEAGATHELNEAATDPQGGGYVGVDSVHQLAYSFFLAPSWELGDACELFKYAFYDDAEPSFMYGAQRQWSNRSATAGHNPCVPAPIEPFYNLTGFPSEQTTVNVNLSSLDKRAGTLTGNGYKGTLNQPLTFHLGAFSDAPTSGTWSVTAQINPQYLFRDMNGNPVDNGTATVTMDKTSVINGDKITVTVTPTSWGGLGNVFIVFKNDLSGATAHGDYPVVISEN